MAPIPRIAVALFDRGSGGTEIFGGSPGSFPIPPTTGDDDDMPPPVSEAFSATVTIDRNAYQTYAGAGAVNLVPAGSGHANGYTKTILFPAGTATGVTFAPSLNVDADTFDTARDYLAILTYWGNRLFGRALSLNAVDSTAPTVSSAATNSAGTQITVTFSETLDSSSVPAASAFTLSGTSATVASVGVAGAVVTLTLSGTVAGGQTVTLAYAQPGTGRLRDASGNNVASFTGRAVTNSVSASIASVWAGSWVDSFNATTHTTRDGSNNVTAMTTQQGATWTATGITYSATGGLNNRAYIEKAGATDLLRTANAAIAGAIDGRTATLAGTFSTSATTSAFIFSWGNAASGTGNVALWANSGTWQIFQRDNGSSVVQSNSSVAANTSQHTFLLEITTTNWRLWIDGVEVAGSPFALATATITTAHFAIGGQDATDGSQAFNAATIRIGELHWGSGGLTNQQITDTLAYLAGLAA